MLPRENQTDKMIIREISKYEGNLKWGIVVASWDEVVQVFTRCGTYESRPVVTDQADYVEGFDLVLVNQNWKSCLGNFPKL